MNLANTLELLGDLTLASAQDLALNGSVGGAGGLTKTGSGTLSLGGGNTYQGDTNLAGGTLLLESDTALGLGALNADDGTQLDSRVAVNLGNAVNLAGTLAILGSNDLSLSGPINGLGGLSKTGPGNLTLAGANTFDGGVVLGAGSLTLGDDAALGSGTLSVIGDGTLSGTTALQIANAIGLASTSARTWPCRARSAVTAPSPSRAAVNCNSRAITASPAARCCKPAACCWAPPDALPILLLGTANALGSGALSVIDDALLDITQALTVSNAINLTSGNLTLGGAQDLVLDGVIAGGGALVKNGGASLTLAGANTFGGATQLNGGTLIVKSVAAAR